MLIQGDLVHCPTLGQLEILHNHLLEVNDLGFITYVSHSTTPEARQKLETSPSDVTKLPGGTFLLPTFCDLHLHAPQFLYQGTGLHLPLMQWLDEYAFKAEESLDLDPQLARKVYGRLADRLIENGTTAVLLFGTIKEETNLILAEVMQSAGIRAFVGKLSMDISSRKSYVEASVQEALSSFESFAEKCFALGAHLPEHKRLVEPVITPRFVPTCSDALLAGLGALADAKSLRVQSHLAESHDQVEWVKRERGIDDIQVFQNHNLLTPRTVQAHCTFLNQPDLQTLDQCGTAVAHCPLSNAYFSEKPFPLREALQQHIKVGLGTDIAGGYSIDIMNAMRQAVSISRTRQGDRIMARSESGISSAADTEHASLGVDWIEALYLATHGGAVALGLPRGCGKFEVGAPFDAQSIHVFDAETGTGVGQLDFFGMKEQVLSAEIVEKWWCLGDWQNRTDVWVQGASVARKL